MQKDTFQFFCFKSNNLFIKTEKVHCQCEAYCLLPTRICKQFSSNPHSPLQVLSWTACHHTQILFHWFEIFCNPLLLQHPKANNIMKFHHWVWVYIVCLCWHQHQLGIEQHNKQQAWKEFLIPIEVLLKPGNCFYSLPWSLHFSLLCVSIYVYAVVSEA